MSAPDEVVYLSGPKVDRRYGICSRTRARWQANPALNFPKPLNVNGRDIYKICELEQWERERAAMAASTEAA